MVRLIRYGREIIYYPDKESQFHYGSIDTKLKQFILQQVQFRLNSTMVRLIHIRMLDINQKNFRLNSTMVRLIQKNQKE